jgi:DNA polymerase III epsilon subunit-like protein
MHAPLDRLVEIAALKFRGVHKVAEFSTLVDPGSPIPPEAIAVHGIDDAAVRGAPKARAAIAEFFRFCGEAPLVAHNAPFDASILAGEMARARIDPPPNPILDTRLLAKALVRTDSYSLVNLVKALGLPAGTHHRALADALHVFHLVRRLLERLGDPDGVLFGEVLRRNAPISFERYLPKPPSLGDDLRPLAAAASSGESVTIDYAVEGTRRTSLLVTPRLLFAKEGGSYMEALCHASGIVKTYRLERIHGLRAETGQGLLF